MDAKAKRVLIFVGVPLNMCEWEIPIRGARL